MPVSHFISPQVIDIDDVNAKVEAAVDFVPIGVHAVYLSDQPVELRLVNTTPTEDSPTYKVEDYGGNILDAAGIISALSPALVTMRHVSVNGQNVDEADLSGSNLTTIKAELSSLLFPTAAEDTGGNFKLKKEVFKTVSSYLTAHSTLSLTSSMVDVSGVALEQLSAAESIADELLRFSSLPQDAEGDDTKSYLNTMLDINNGNEVFGPNSLQSVVFIVKSVVTTTVDTTVDTGIQAASLSAISSITHRSQFADEVGADLTAQKYLGQDSSSTDINGEWYAALCFKLAIAPP